MVSSRTPGRGPRGVGRGLFVDHGFVADHQRLGRLAVEPRFFDRTEGTTDSELVFFLALTFGLDEDPPPALERMAGFVEATGHRHGVVEPLQMTVGVSNGERLYGVRYASGQAEANSL